MKQPLNFKDLPIKFIERDTFVGDKIEIRKVFDKRIEILKYKIGESRYKGDFMSMQVVLDGKKYLIETASKNLMHYMRQIPDELLPFKTTITEIDNTYKFT